MKYARILENMVQEIFVPQEGFTIEESFHPDVAKQFIEVPNEVEQNWIKNPDGTFSAPVEPVLDNIQEA